MNSKVPFRTISAFIRTNLGRYVRPRRYDQIFHEIERIKPLFLMEVGVWNGARAKRMIETAAKFHNISDIHYFGFDLFEELTDEIYKKEMSKKPPTKSEILKYLEKTGATISLISGDTHKTLGFNHTLPQMDFVFIDGGHATKTVKNDWNGIEKMMRKGTTVIFDDYWHNRDDGPKKVIDAIDRNKYIVTILPEVDVFFNPDFGRLVISLAKVILK